MKRLMPTTLLLFSLSAPAAEFHHPRPEGVYEYRQRISVTLLRRAEQVPIGTVDGERRRKELRDQGFTCLRKNTKLYLCTRREYPSTWPSEVNESVDRALNGLSLSFSRPEAAPELRLDTSTEQEWIIRDPVKLGRAQVTLYALVYSYATGRIRLAFPVSEEQPLSYVEMESPRLLRIPLTVTAREGSQTLGYVIEALLESR